MAERRGGSWSATAARGPLSSSDREMVTVAGATEHVGRPRRPRLVVASASRRDAVVLGATALLASTVVVLVSRPGHMTRDSHDQLEQARSLVLTDHHPVVMSVLWHYLDQLIPGPLGLLILMSVLFWTGLAALVLTFRRPLVCRVVAMLAVGFFPPVFAIAGVIWKDTLMQAALLTGAGCLLVFLRSRRCWLLVLGIAACAFASVTRHNGLAATWPLLMLPWLVAPGFPRLRWPARLLAAAGAALVSTVATTALVLQLLGTFTEREAFWQLIATFDIAGISVNTDRQLFDRRSPVLRRGASLDDLRRCFRSSNHLTLYQGCRDPSGARQEPLLSRVYEPAELESLASNWRRAVLAEPLGYLRHRRDVYCLVIGLTPQEASLNYGPTSFATDYPLSSTARSIQDSMLSLASTPLFRVWIYVALALAAAVAAVPFYRRTGSALPLVFALSSLSYSASLFFAAGARDYRYSVWTVLASVLALLAFAAPGRLRPASGR